MTSKKKTPKRAKTKVTMVIWYDAVAETGWTTQTDAMKQCKLSECVSIGHLVDVNKERILIACTKSENEYNAMINIPNAWVKETKEYWL